MPLLLTLALVLVSACVSGCLLLLRHAPAGSLALFGCMAGGFAAFAVSSSDGPRGVPQDTAVWATASLMGVGLVGLVVTRGRAPSRALRHTAIAVLAVAPAAAALFHGLLVLACPLYVTGRTYCHYDFDMLGGWSAGVAILFLLDLLALAVIVGISARQAHSREATASPATASAQPGR